MAVFSPQHSDLARYGIEQLVRANALAMGWVADVTVDKTGVCVLLRREESFFMTSRALPPLAVLRPWWWPFRWWREKARRELLAQAPDFLRFKVSLAFEEAWPAPTKEAGVEDE